ncbi:MAG TPA: hypothetical protein VFF88_03380 [Methylocella sp.]|nr:hypothetical protein [Methylocella sp.]
MSDFDKLRKAAAAGDEIAKRALPLWRDIEALERRLESLEKERNELFHGASGLPRRGRTLH